MGLLSTLFSFHGRINRAQYWLTSIICSVVSVMLSFSTAGMHMSGAKGDPAAGLGAALGLLFISLVSLAFSVISVAAQVKRFHDRGRTGYLALAPLIPLAMIVIEVISAFVSGADPMRVVGSLALWIAVLMGISLWFFIDLGCLPGVDGPNKYGNPPGSGGGSPASTTPIPGAPGAQAAPAAGSLFGAQSAIDRAIAEKAQGAPAQAQARPQLRPATAPMQPAPAGGAPSFGRRTR